MDGGRRLALSDFLPVFVKETANLDRDALRARFERRMGADGVGKRLVGAFGYRIGIPLQAAIFGGLHLLLASDVTPLSSAILLATTAIGGFLLGYLAERPFKGSILPGALLHGLGNFIVNACRAYF